MAFVLGGVRIILARQGFLPPVMRIPRCHWQASRAGGLGLQVRGRDLCLFYGRKYRLVGTLRRQRFVECLCRDRGLDWFTLNDIYLPNADPTLRRNVYRLFGHDVTAMAWHSINANMCEDPPEAVGTANFINTDNDYYAPYQDNRNSNAWGYKATGTLMVPDGQVYKLNLVYRISWDGVDGTRREYCVQGADDANRRTLTRCGK